MVSVIVDACNSHKYLIRNLNSIRRQTYKNTEIIVVAKDNIDKPLHNDVKLIMAEDFCKGLSKAVEGALGERIYFCTGTCVLTDNVIEELLEVSSDSKLCVYTKIYIKSNTDYELYRGLNASLFGKLVNKDMMVKVLTDKYDNQLSLAIAYMRQCDGLISSDSALLYESCKDLEVCEAVIGAAKESMFKAVLKGISETVTNTQVRNFITSGIGEMIAASVADTENMMFYIKECMSQDMWLNYAVARKTMVKWWNNIQNGKCIPVYTKFINYISDFDDETIKLILSSCDINKEIFEIMKNNEQDVFLSIYNSIKNDATITVVNKTAAANNNSQAYSYELSGMQLADYVVDKYRSGSLGLKTFFKSFGAWIKFKLKR